MLISTKDVELFPKKGGAKNILPDLVRLMLKCGTSASLGSHTYNYAAPVGLTLWSMPKFHPPLETLSADNCTRKSRSTLSKQNYLYLHGYCKNVTHFEGD